MRASDEERRRVIGVLQRHTEEGRLSLDEFSDRVGAVYAAKTLDDLRAAVVDLPALGAKPPAETPDRHLLVIFALAIAVVVVFAVVYTLLK